MAFPTNQRRRVAIQQSRVLKLAKPWGPASAGARAFRSGQTPVDCPYVLESIEWRQWMAGWLAQYDRRFAS